MTDKPRKQRADSKDAAVAAFLAANRDIQPPAHVPLEEKDMPFFASVIGEFARSEWTDHQLELAAMLARMMADLDSEMRLLRSEGTVMYSEKGTPVVSPRKTTVQMFAGSILSMRRSLSLHARAQSGEPRDTGKRRGIAKQNEADANSLDDDLIARPV